MKEQTTATPIKPIVPAVFVYVTNIRRSVEWYSKLLGLPVPEHTREDLHIFDMSGSQCSNIFLDRRDEVAPSAEALFSLTAPNLENTVRYLNELGITIVREEEQVVHFQDPDGNVLMACSI